MVYLIAALMGYFVGINSTVERQARTFIGMGYANPTAAKMSALGGFGGWFCIIPAAYFVGSEYDKGFWDGALFCVAALGGAFVAGFLRFPSVSYLISVLTLPVNIALAVLVYFLTRG